MFKDLRCLMTKNITIIRLLSRALLINIALIVVVSIVVLWVPARAAERRELLELSKAIRQVVEKNMPAVVNIEATQQQTVTNPFSPFENDPLLQHFFNPPPITKEFGRELKGLGTGFLIDSKGHVLTSSHLVEGATGLQVLLNDGRQYPAELLGTDPKTDLAVIRVRVNEMLPSVTFGDSEKIGVGDWVVAIGYPPGHAPIVTLGIIGAKHRAGIKDVYGYQDFLKTDTTINWVSNGGPLINLSGEVIGVNSAVVSKSSGFEGIGFAVPSNTAVHIAKRLFAHGRVVRSWIGVGVQNLTPGRTRSLGLKRPAGVLITHVADGGPADRAGIKRGDVVTGYQGKEISSGAALQNEVAASPMGQEATITVFRNRKKEILAVEVGNLQERINRQASSIKHRLGVDVRPVTVKETEHYGLDSPQGLVIISIHPNSPLAHIGFEEKDMILEINGRPIDSPEGFADLLNALRPEQQIIMRGLDHRSSRKGYVQVVVP
jgi:serine protease Do